MNRNSKTKRKLNIENRKDGMHPKYTHEMKRILSPKASPKTCGRKRSFSTDQILTRRHSVVGYIQKITFEKRRRYLETKNKNKKNKNRKGIGNGYGSGSKSADSSPIESTGGFDKVKHMNKLKNLGTLERENVAWKSFGFSKNEKKELSGVRRRLNKKILRISRGRNGSSSCNNLVDIGQKKKSNKNKKKKNLRQFLRSRK